MLFIVCSIHKFKQKLTRNALVSLLRRVSLTNISLHYSWTILFTWQTSNDFWIHRGSINWLRRLFFDYNIFNFLYFFNKLLQVFYVVTSDMDFIFEREKLKKSSTNRLIYDDTSLVFHLSFIVNHTKLYNYNFWRQSFQTSQQASLSYFHIS